MLVKEYRVKETGEIICYTIIIDLNVHRLIINTKIKYIDNPLRLTLSNIEKNHDVIFDSKGFIIFTYELPKENIDGVITYKLDDGIYYICDTIYNIPRAFQVLNGKISEGNEYHKIQPTTYYKEPSEPLFTYYCDVNISAEDIVNIKDLLYSSEIKFMGNEIIYKSDNIFDKLEYYPISNNDNQETRKAFIYDKSYCQLYSMEFNTTIVLKDGWNIITDCEDCIEPHKIFFYNGHVFSEKEYENLKTLI